MLKKASLAHIIFFIVTLYIISPWFFAKYLLFNEIISFIGLIILGARRFRVGTDPISICVVCLIGLGSLHAVVSLFRFDTLYYYLRNLVILYSMLAFFIGFYCLRYLPSFIERIRKPLRIFVAPFLFIRMPHYIFERFGMATLFPALIRHPGRRMVPFLLVGLNICYGLTYDSLTALVLSAFYLLLFISPGLKFFKSSLLIFLLAFTIIFITLVPNLGLIKNDYSPVNYIAIRNVMRSNPLLNIDGNATWRLVLWKEVIVDNFPANIAGLGFGTPVMTYYPVENIDKLASLPYVLGAHNSFVYLFGRLGILFILLIIPVYAVVFREYFRYRSYWYAGREILIFWSFFAVSMIALFNPVLESPVYASGYWLILGLVSRCIYNRRSFAFNPSLRADIVHT